MFHTDIVPGFCCEIVCLFPSMFDVLLRSSSSGRLIYSCSDNRAVVDQALSQDIYKLVGAICERGNSSLAHDFYPERVFMISSAKASSRASFAVLQFGIDTFLDTNTVANSFERCLNSIHKEQVFHWPRPETADNLHARVMSSPPKESRTMSPQ
ncbi:hypothetical protein P280DRAFT_197352 [Massarina eburnea CBS 473.64]|uniref:Uncharacterized protein n=1 Tax=Massarina eburnea CBS 473.64 TaxID=1395130 RepID=A0A6A6RIN7_9PLEO|nr:hypothetical protein P280DRAFT_197352 [Massarina eburnea CBS 473.64]